MKAVFLYVIAVTLALGGETAFNESFEVCAYLANEPEVRSNPGQGTVFTTSIPAASHQAVDRGYSA